MAMQDRLQRNVKPGAAVPQDYSDEESFHTEDEDVDSDQVVDEDDEADDSEAQSGTEDEDVEQQINAVSFGALKKANDVLSRKRKADDADGPDQEAKLESLRKRLQLIKQAKAGSVVQQKSTARPVDRASKHAKPVERQRGETKDGGSSSSQDDSDSGSEPEELTTKGRAKHAPAAQSSRYQVSRKRQVIEVPKNTSRDPRFDSIRQADPASQAKDKHYDFLLDYQKSEMQELKAAIKKTKNEDDKTKLRRTLNAMENRLKSREAKKREEDIVRKHKKQEREQVKEGKTPYFLKRSEIKQQALVEKFEGMKSKDREKLMERRRKKDSQRERRMMPNDRRLA